MLFGKILPQMITRVGTRALRVRPSDFASRSGEWEALVGHRNLDPPPAPNLYWLIAIGEGQDHFTSGLEFLRQFRAFFQVDVCVKELQHESVREKVRDSSSDLTNQ
jgi:hypothetical protein